MNTKRFAKCQKILRSKTRKKHGMATRLSSMPLKEHKSGNIKRLIERRKNVKIQSLKKNRVTTHISSLPLEIIENVFSYLSVSDRLSSSLVCRRWRQAMHDPSLTENIWLTVRSSDLNTMKGWQRKTGAALSRRFVNFELCQIYISNFNSWFLKDYGRNVKRLILNRCQVSEVLSNYSLWDVKEYCTNLVYLKFFRCFVPIFHSLPKLKVLYLEECATDFALMHFDRTIPHLEFLHLNFNQHSFDVLSNQVDYNSLYVNPSKLSISTPVLLKFLYARRRTLTTIKMSNPNFAFKVELLGNALQISDFRLNRLPFSDFRIEKISQFFEFFQTSIVEMVFDRQVTRRTLLALEKHLTPVGYLFNLFLLILNFEL